MKHKTRTCPVCHETKGYRAFNIDREACKKCQRPPTENTRGIWRPAPLPAAFICWAYGIRDPFRALSWRMRARG